MKQHMLGWALLATFSTAFAAAGDQDFVTEAGQGGHAEVALSKLAAQQGSSAAVKKFAAQMVTDHTKANGQLKVAAGKAGATVPDGPSDKQQEKLAELKALKGAEFDKAYADAMLKDHKDTVALFEKESRNGADAPVKTFATATLPTLKHHLKMAEELQTQTK